MSAFLVPCEFFDDIDDARHCGGHPHNETGKPTGLDSAFQGHDTIHDLDVHDVWVDRE